MDVVERFQMALRREGESDHIGSFCQSIMPIFAKNWDDVYGDDVEDEHMVTTTLKDFTMYKFLGFESSWAGTPGGVDGARGPGGRIARGRPGGRR